MLICSKCQSSDIGVDIEASAFLENFLGHEYASVEEVEVIIKCNKCDTKSLLYFNCEGGEYSKPLNVG